MSNIFLASDHHLSHSNILTFLTATGAKLRNFESIEEHDEHIISKHNSVVRPQDRVYFLGDFTFHNKYLHLAGRMNGRKVLIKGNHDTLKLSQYVPYFDDIRACHALDGMLLSHIPLHEDSLSRWGRNIHGHLHGNRVMRAPTSGSVVLHNAPKVVDNRYYSVCMEQLDDYTPISLEQLKLKLKNIDLN